MFEEKNSHYYAIMLCMDDTLHEEDDLMIFEDLEELVRQMCLCLYVCIVNLYFVNLVLVKTTFPQKRKKVWFGIVWCTFFNLRRPFVVNQTIGSLRAVPTIVIAHTFCASRDTRGFLSVMLSNTVIFLCGLKLSVESRSV